MTKLIRSTALLAIVALAATSAIAQPPPFEAEVDCDGIFSPGNTVPILLELTNQTDAPISISVRVAVDIPLRGEHTLLERSANLPPNRTRNHRRNLVLPQGAPNGEYTILMTADSDTTMTFDTCSFHVQ